MKRIRHNLLLLCGLLLAVGCQREKGDVPITSMVDIAITTDTAETRTYINESAQRVEWSSDDKIIIFENSSSATSRPAIITNGKATFSASFANTPLTKTFTYNALYPAASYIGTSSGIDVERIAVTLPDTQHATTESFDPAADMLIAKPQTTNTQAQALSMQFKRIVALAKLSITGLPSGTRISEVEFSANGKSLAGACSIDLSMGEIAASSNAKECVTVSYDTSVASTTPIYFNCYPTTLTEGDSFSVTITTDKGNKYTKSVTLTPGRTLTFEQGNLNTFRVDMSGISAVEPEVDYQVGNIYDIYGSKGVAYAIKADKQGCTWVYFFSMDEADLQWSTENVWCNCLSIRGDWNTEDMLRNGTSPDNYPAAQWCVAHGDGWFMPSSEELQWMWDAISNNEHNFQSASVAAYNKLLSDNGGMPFVETYYWSSNETTDDMIEVIAFMADSIVCLAPYKSSKLTVRAVCRKQIETAN